RIARHPGAPGRVERHPVGKDLPVGFALRAGGVLHAGQRDHAAAVHRHAVRAAPCRLLRQFETRALEAGFFALYDAGLAADDQLRIAVGEAAFHVHAAPLVAQRQRVGGQFALAPTQHHAAAQCEAALAIQVKGAPLALPLLILRLLRGAGYRIRGDAPGRIIIRAAWQQFGGLGGGLGPMRMRRGQGEGDGDGRKARSGHESPDYNVVECPPTPDLLRSPDGSRNWAALIPAACAPRRPMPASVVTCACGARMAPAGSRWTRRPARKTWPPIWRYRHCSRPARCTCPGCWPPLPGRVSRCLRTSATPTCSPRSTGARTPGACTRMHSIHSRACSSMAPRSPTSFPPMTRPPCCVKCSCCPTGIARITCSCDSPPATTRCWHAPSTGLPGRRCCNRRCSCTGIIIRAT